MSKQRVTVGPRLNDSYEGEANRPIQREFYDITYELGMKFKF